MNRVAPTSKTADVAHWTMTRPFFIENMRPRDPATPPEPSFKAASTRGFEALSAGSSEKPRLASTDIKNAKSSTVGVSSGSKCIGS